MKAVVTGGVGFLGSNLCRRLLAGGDGPDFRQIVVMDTVAPPADLTANSRVRFVAGDVGDGDAVRGLIDRDTDCVFHLAAVVSAAAEADFDLGYHVNRSGVRNVLEACRDLARTPRVVFASSIAVYGGEAVAEDRTPVRPRTSYGTQKVVGELLLNDYTRKGFVDGRAVRLPAVLVRAGEPNPAASTFTSSIVREPLLGRAVDCPVAADTPLPMVSISQAVEALLRAYALDGAALGVDRAVLLGGRSPTAGDTVAALARIAGAKVASRVSWRPDPAIQAFVDSWPRRLVAERAARLGFAIDDGVEDIIRQFIDDELGGVVVAEA